MGYFIDTTVEIEFKGKKVRVSPSVAEAISKNPKHSKPKSKAKPKK